MDALDYIERESANTLQELMKEYAATFERYVRLLTLLTGACGALLAFWLGRTAPSAGLHTALAVLLAGWAWAVWLLVQSLAARRLDAGAVPGQMVGVYEERAQIDAPPDADALRWLRLSEFNRREAAIADYIGAIDARAAAFDKALRWACAVPICSALASALVVLLVRALATPC